MSTKKFFFVKDLKKLLFQNKTQWHFGPAPLDGSK